MRCPFCGHAESRVVDSRPTAEGSVIRRRRECNGCQQRFTTYERVEEQPLVVIKKDGRRESFDRKKILAGLLKACEKRPISLETLEGLVDDVERELRRSMKGEVRSREVGDLVMARLRELDEVAYVRFASVYRQFADVTSFMDELRELMQYRKCEREG